MGAAGLRYGGYEKISWANQQTTTIPVPDTLEDTNEQELRKMLWNIVLKMKKRN